MSTAQATDGIADEEVVELILLGVAGTALVAAAFLAFKLFWPSPADPTSAPSRGALLGGGRPFTTGQIARGVFWGMWLFWLSQIVVVAVVMFLLLVFGAIATGPLGS